ncbi:MAG: YtjB family periplasmic protein [Pasteurellaceae bacterium]|nr:YtjB family periplasmic protein [Pasteurellaceae bacterium]
MQIVKEKALKSTLFTVILLLCFTVIAVLLIGVKQFKLSSQLASASQVANLSHLLVRQQTNLFSILLTNNTKAEQLKENLDNFAKQSFVVDASLYASNGELLAQSTDNLDLRNQLGLDDNITENNDRQIVEPIYSSNGIEGFLRVTFDAKYGQTTQHKIDQLFHQLYGEFIIVFLAGILLASSMHYFLSHYQRAHRKKELAGKNAKTRTINRYPRRRRRISTS